MNNACLSAVGNFFELHSTYRAFAGLVELLFRTLHRTLILFFYHFRLLVFGCFAVPVTSGNN